MSSTLQSNPPQPPEMEPVSVRTSRAFPSPASSRPATRAWHRRLVKPVLALALAALLVWVVKIWLFPVDGPSNDITASVARADLPITVTERGELESSKTVEVRCDVEGHQNKIVSIVPEGTRV